MLLAIPNNPLRPSPASALHRQLLVATGCVHLWMKSPWIRFVLRALARVQLCLPCSWTVSKCIIHTSNVAQQLTKGLTARQYVGLTDVRCCWSEFDISRVLGHYTGRRCPKSGCPVSHDVETVVALHWKQVAGFCLRKRVTKNLFMRICVKIIVRVVPVWNLLYCYETELVLLICRA